MYANNAEPVTINARMALQEFVQDRNINAYNKKQLIFQEGKQPANIFYVIKGKVRTFLRNNNGKELVVDLYHSGDFFGYTPLFANTNYKEYAEAMEYTEVAIIPKDEFMELVYHNTDVAREFYRLMARNIIEKERQLLNLAYDSLRRKVAEALLLMQIKFSQDVDECFMINISRENMASIAGTATESLIRTLSDFKSDGIIEIDHSGSIRIVNLKRLQHLLDIE